VTSRGIGQDQDGQDQIGQDQDVEVAVREATYDPPVRRRRRVKRSWLRRVTTRPRHFIRRHRALSVLVGIAILLLILLLLWLWFLNRKIDDVPRFDTDLGPDRPPAVGVGTNILLVGVDDGGDKDVREMVADGEWQPGVFRSDAIMVVHISEDWSRAQVVSIPRDSYVPVDGYGRTKINASFSYGGPSLLGRTVEQYTGLRLDHVVVADFDGFSAITDVLGGVMVYIPPASANPQHSTLQSGWHILDGTDTLAYVRQRHGLPRGDFDRVQRQQSVLRAMLNRAHRWQVMLNPVTATKVIQEITGKLAVDESLTTARLRELGWAARSIGDSSVNYATVPWIGTPMIDGASVVTLDHKGVRELFEAIGHDQFDTYVREYQLDQLPPPDQVQ